jgi:hypothetical protein
MALNLTHSVNIVTTWDAEYTQPFGETAVLQRTFTTLNEKTGEVLDQVPTISSVHDGISDILVIDDETVDKVYVTLKAESNNTESVKVFIKDQNDVYLAFAMLDPGALLYIPLHVEITAESGNTVALQGITASAVCNVIVSAGVSYK